MCFAVIEDDIETVNILRFFSVFQIEPRLSQTTKHEVALPTEMLTNIYCLL